MANRYTSLESDRSVRDVVHDNGRVLTVGEIVNLLNGMPHLRLRIAPGSSAELIRERLRGDEAQRNGQVLIIDFDVWVHHCTWHEDLRRAVGADSDQIRGEGNFGIVGDGRLVVRWKSGTEPELIREANAMIQDEFAPV